MKSVTLQKGFTLVELIVVITILALLMTVGITSYQNTLKSTRDAKRFSDLKELKNALDIYYAKNGEYPSTSGGWWTVCTSGADPTARTTTGADGWIPDLAPGFIEELPVDPQGCDSGGYGGYIYRSDGLDYKVAADWSAEVGAECGEGGAFYDGNRQNPRFCSLSTPGADLW